MAFAHLFDIVTFNFSEITTNYNKNKNTHPQTHKQFNLPNFIYIHIVHL